MSVRFVVWNGLDIEIERERKNVFFFRCRLEFRFVSDNKVTELNTTQLSTMMMKEGNITFVRWNKPAANVSNEQPASSS